MDKQQVNQLGAPNLSQPRITEEQLKESTLNAMASAFEFGYKCCEQGMNMQMAQEQFNKVMKG